MCFILFPHKPISINNQHNEEMKLEVTREELKLALHSFKKEKSPRLDGWKTKFYLGFYDFPEYLLFRLIEESNTSWRVLGDLNATFITLIIKK